ncbi:MAG: hypothetical protein ABIK92_21850 [Pseudomonadota bacterium]|uniref:Uncharacterized protein n=1 Tax=viral metagenome TaxID=1070528 RepID=A0A6M3L177_9ZZZZ
MKGTGVKKKWRVEYELGPSQVSVGVEVEARGALDAATKANRIMQKEWGKTQMGWRFMGAKAIEDL